MENSCPEQRYEMSLLNNPQKELLFDYCLGLTTENESAQAQKLISSNEQAADIYENLKAALVPLESLEAEPCPDELAEGTVWRLKNAARASHLRLETLLAKEQAKEAVGGSHFWRGLGELVAAAAAVVIFTAVLVVPLNFARQKAWQQRCQMNLRQIGQGVNQYGSDYDDRLPTVATTMGAPWWKVGYQGKENHSNTRHIWLLPKGGYVSPECFVCPGKTQGRFVKFDPQITKNYNDFSSRESIHYSLRVRCNKSAGRTAGVPKALMADLNPLFERLPQNFANDFKLELDKKLLRLNSINHKRRGQNVLFCDGSSRFVKKRYVGITEDDIFTLQDTNVYKGTEVPSSETDAFLAP